MWHVCSLNLENDNTFSKMCRAHIITSKEVAHTLFGFDLDKLMFASSHTGMYFL